MSGAVRTERRLRLSDSLRAVPAVKYRRECTVRGRKWKPPNHENPSARRRGLQGNAVDPYPAQSIARRRRANSRRHFPCQQTEGPHNWGLRRYFRKKTQKRVLGGECVVFFSPLLLLPLLLLFV